MDSKITRTNLQSKISRLPSHVIELVKSSITITDLADVVVGLVKNSMDAESCQLSIYVNFSRGSCTVEDDGCGIAMEEFREEGGLGKPFCCIQFEEPDDLPNLLTGKSRDIEIELTQHLRAMWEFPGFCDCLVSSFYLITHSIAEAAQHTHVSPLQSDLTPCPGSRSPKYFKVPSRYQGSCSQPLWLYACEDQAKSTIRHLTIYK